VDPAGAESLRVRLEQQAHWQTADAVRDGRQPSVDPDRADLERIENGVRLYTEQIIHGVRVRHCKQLVEGVWVSGTITESSDHTSDPTGRTQLASFA
jgi:hypothetical protein